MKKLWTVLFVSALLFLLGIQSYSQAPVKNYDQQWKNVEDFQKKNLPKSALAEVKKIYELAKKDKQDAQVIKSLIYMSSLQQENRENNEVLSISDIEKELTASQQTGKEPVIATLNSLLASMYWNYYSRHRWQLLNVTQTVNFVKTDIATWAAEDFYKKVSELYLRSIKEGKILQQTKLETYDALIIKGNVRHLRPTLFDLLANAALSYFSNDERDVNKPAYAFEIDQASAFDPAADFITRKFPTKDSLSLYQKALLLYQQLIAFHLADAKPDALIDVDLQRIEFVKTKSVHPDKDQLYFNALNHIASQYQNLPAASQAWYLLAAYYESQAMQYKAYGDSSHRLDRIKAKDICDKVIAQKDSTEGKINCINLLARINEPLLQFSLEKVTVPNQPFRAFVQYRNINRIFLRLVIPDDKLKKELEHRYNESYWTALVNAAPTKTWEQTLPSTTDMQQHRVEIKLEGLPAGEYILLASTYKDFSNKQTNMGAMPFYVSNISFINKKDDYFILNRDNGQPLAGASVQLWEQKYDYATSKYAKAKTALYKTDANGYFHVQRTRDKNNPYRVNPYQLEITYNKDKLFMNDLISDYTYYPIYDDEQKKITRIFLFTDRSIYRPGQIVYFKGISLVKDIKENNSTISANHETIVFLRDANSQTVDSIKVKSNEFGSFSGKFQLPASGLNGNFTLVTTNNEGNQNFREWEKGVPG